MDAEYFSSLLPTSLFASDEFSNAVFVNIINVFNHAHAVFCSIALV